ncbi:MAG: glycosyltransferase [bacterium]|nr:glycosyltransferase [bacterium]
MLTSLGYGLMLAGFLGVVCVSLGYPILVKLLGRLRGDSSSGGDLAQTEVGKVSLIVAMRNAESLLPAKLTSIAALQDPGGGIEVILASDGSTDRTVPIAVGACKQQPDWRVIQLQAHEGKHRALDAATVRATGGIMVFSDVDALLERDSLIQLLKPFQSASVGGVCGQRLLGEPEAFHSDSQGRYVQIDSELKSLEGKIGSITSNDGKLYAIRSELYETIPGGVTDDLYASMSVVRQGWKFVFAPRARAWIRVPSRNEQHEFRRRRRIVCRSLRGIWLQRSVLNPFKTGLYAFGLGINKVGRRLLPFFLAAIIMGTWFLAVDSPPARWAALLQLLATGLILGEPRLRSHLDHPSMPRKLGQFLRLSNYAAVGLIGTALGVLDFALARKVVRWDPIKSD